MHCNAILSNVLYNLLFLLMLSYLVATIPDNQRFQAVEPHLQKL